MACHAQAEGQGDSCVGVHGEVDRWGVEGSPGPDDRRGSVTSDDAEDGQSDSRHPSLRPRRLGRRLDGSTEQGIGLGHVPGHVGQPAQRVALGGTFAAGFHCRLHGPGSSLVAGENHGENRPEQPLLPCRRVTAHLGCPKEVIGSS